MTEADLPEPFQDMLEELREDNAESKMLSPAYYKLIEGTTLAVFERLAQYLDENGWEVRRRPPPKDEPPYMEAMRQFNEERHRRMRESRK